MFAVVDIETNSLNPKTGSIIEISIQYFNESEHIGGWSTLVKPCGGVGKTEIHGITELDVLYAPEFKDIAEKVKQSLDGYVVVAHNINFDMPFIKEELARCGLKINPCDEVCTLLMSKSMYGNGGNKLDQCCQRHGIEIGEYHRAKDDSIACGKLLLKYLQKIMAKPAWLESVQTVPSFLME